MISSSLLIAFLPFFSLSITAQRTITVKNQCPSTIWPAILSPIPETAVPDQPTGWELPAGEATTFQVPPNWTAGRIWARTGCVMQDGNLRCLTGQCGVNDGQQGTGSLECSAGGEPPATLAEFTLAPEGLDHYDVSLVDGFNVPMIINPSSPDCPKPDCSVNINTVCPDILRTRLDQNGLNLGCMHSCIKGFGMESGGNRACCTGGYDDAELCAICGVDYYNVFKESCPNSYAYAYDEKSQTALFTCPSDTKSNYEIIFCPNGTDYIGLKKASTQFKDDLAICSNKVQGGNFEVKPSPTELATIGDIKYTAMPGTGSAISTVTAGPTNGTGAVPASSILSSRAGSASATSGTSSEAGLSVQTGSSPSRAGDL